MKAHVEYFMVSSMFLFATLTCLQVTIVVVLDIS
uniref:Uncharacterized protein n=1 Tax=Arundo donax TaxID=35708 RepID=A0A0A9AGU5_ARUDO